MCVFMIQPISTLTPKVFRGDSSKRASAMRTKKRVALLNAGGISIVTGGTATVLARNITSSWGHAGTLGFLAAGVMMMFLAPNFLYKSGINTNAKETESIAKVLDTKKINIGNYSKALLKK